MASVHVAIDILSDELLVTPPWHACVAAPTSIIDLHTPPREQKNLSHQGKRLADTLATDERCVRACHEQRASPPRCFACSRAKWESECLAHKELDELNQELWHSEVGVLTCHEHLSYQDRAVAVDWLVKVHLDFGLHEEVLGHTISLLDRFLQCRPKTHLRELQLIAGTALFIAAKFDTAEACPIGKVDLEAICAKAYSTKRILAMEARLLIALNYRLSSASATTVLRMLVHYTELELLKPEGVPMLLASYILELAYVDGNLLRYETLMLSTSALYLAFLTLGKRCCARRAAAITRVELIKLQPCVHGLLKLQRADANSNSNSSALLSVRNKYAHATRGAVSGIPCINSTASDELA